MHTCTHRPSPLFCQTTMAISMRKANVRSHSAAARASAAPCGFPTERQRSWVWWKEGAGLSWEKSTVCLRRWFFYTQLKCSFVSGPVPQARLVTFSSEHDLGCPGTLLEFRWRSQQQQVIKDWEHASLAFPSWDFNCQPVIPRSLLFPWRCSLFWQEVELYVYI